MAAYPIVVVHPDGLVEIPKEYRQDPRFQSGAHLQLVPVRPVPTGQERKLAWESFRRLRGILADSDYDPNAELEKEKQRELAEESRWASS